MVAVGAVVAAPGAAAFTPSPSPADFRITHSRGAIGNRLRGAFTPAVAYNPHRDEYLVVWQGPRGSGGYAIYGRRLGPTGARRGGVFRVSPPGGEGARVSAPHIAFNPRSNRYLVAWDVLESTRIAGRTLGPTGALGQMRPLANQQPTGVFSVAWPKFDVDASPGGPGWLVTWGGGDGRILALPLAPSGLKVGEPVQVSPPGEMAQAVATAGSSTGRDFLVTWSVGRGYYGTSIQGRLVTMEGTPVTLPFDISEPEPVTDAESEPRLDQPAVAFQPQTDRFLVVWDDLRAKQLMGRAVTSSGATYHVAMPMSAAPFPSLFRSPTLVAVPGTDGFLVGYPQHAFALVQAATPGGTVGPPIRVSRRRGQPIRYAGLSVPAIAPRPGRRGDLLAVWSGGRDRQNGPDLYGNHLRR